MRPPDSADQKAFVRRLVTLLEQLGIRYAIGGSVAAMAYGEHRFTADIDMALLADTEELARLVEAVSAWHIYIAPLEAIVEEDIPHGLPFNIYDGAAGAKADLYVVADSGLPGSAMRRRRRIRSDEVGLEAWFLAPEDVILYKLDYFRRSEGVSQKHPKDIAKMLAVSGDQLDLAYIERWASEIGVLDLWQALWDEFQKK
ncbi:MAG TPA: hypothetical protein VI793_18115 [Anaerolineales bacterium]|nr:hypothetical protein [Anaerolineales bacterium]